MYNICTYYTYTYISVCVYVIIPLFKNQDENTITPFCAVVYLHNYVFWVLFHITSPVF